VVRGPALLAFGLLLAEAAACGRLVFPRHDAGNAGDDATVGDTAGPDGEADVARSNDDPCANRLPGLGGGPSGLVKCNAGSGVELCGAPMVVRPTGHGFAVHAILASGSPTDLTAGVRRVGETDWQPAPVREDVASDVVEWTFDGLLPGVRYEYQIRRAAGAAEVVYAGSAVTQRRAGDPFAFALLSDSHIGPHATFSNQGNWCTLAAVGQAVGAASPDFMINLGDMLDFHEFGFNQPPPDGSYTSLAYRNYRALLGDVLGHAAHFPVIGNWEGEDGWFSPEDIARSRQARLVNMPGPRPTTYPESGSTAQDYYAFTWGDALFVVLNVMSYTPTPHLLGTGEGAPDDWTLGAAQLEWLSSTLAAATSKWRFLFIHHPVGGAAGNPEDSAYGRGGGRAAHVGEQATVHDWMLKSGAQIFFYGHDHVFTDMTVDGIHYSEPGNAGAIWTFSSSLTGYEQSWLESGWARVAVGPDVVEVTALSMSGEVLYRYQVR
jgi:hypothetical protein